MKISVNVGEVMSLNEALTFIFTRPGATGASFQNVSASVEGSKLESTAIMTIELPSAKEYKA